MITTEAQYKGVCPECGAPINPGDVITSETGGRWQHLKCPPGKLDLVREVCGECFTEKSASGSCMCEVAA